MADERFNISVDRKTKHDLRASLNVIIGYTEMLLEQSEGPMREVSAEDLNAILSAARKLLSQVDQLFEPPKP